MPSATISRDSRVQCHCGHYREPIGSCWNERCPFFAGKTAIEVGNLWSNQDVAVWYENADGSWSIIRSGFSLWNYLGTLATTIRMQSGYYLFPKGFVPA
jgi:hypothetical protein